MTLLAERTPDTNPIQQREEADIHASSDEYAARFSGAVGQWMLEVQERALFKLVDSECTSVLDVGGGHGQIAIPLLKREHSVTVVGSSPVCAQRLTPYLESGSVSFQVGNLVELPYKDRSFDLTTSFRLMSHCVAWRALVAELCRVSQHAVIVDYPVWFSFNLLSPLLFSLKRALEGNTRTYRMFSTFELAREFKKHGFRLERTEKQFMWPMGLHRTLKNPALSALLEAIARALLLTKLFGSPVVAKFVREP